MALNPSGAISLGGPVAGQSIAVELGLGATTTISLNQTNVRTLAGVPSGTIVMPTNFWGKSATTPTQRAIFGYGNTAGPTTAVNTYNLVSNTGVVAANTPGVGTARRQLAATSYGTDKAIFGYGSTSGPTTYVLISNLVSNTGVVATDTSAAGLARSGLAAAGYGTDKGIFGFGFTPTLSPVFNTSITNLVSNTGVIASNTPGVGTIRDSLAAASYGGDKAIFGYGYSQSVIFYNMTNLVSNTGVVASDTPGVGLGRRLLAAAGYGGDKAVFAYGQTPASPTLSPANLVSNTGVVATNSSTIGPTRSSLSGSMYGGDKALFGVSGGASFAYVSNTGVFTSESPTPTGNRSNGAAAGYSLT